MSRLHDKTFLKSTVVRNIYLLLHSQYLKSFGQDITPLMHNKSSTVRGANRQENI